MNQIPALGQRLERGLGRRLIDYDDDQDEDVHHSYHPHHPHHQHPSTTLSSYKKRKRSTSNHNPVDNGMDSEGGEDEDMPDIASMLSESSLSAMVTAAGTRDGREFSLGPEEETPATASSFSPEGEPEMSLLLPLSSSQTGEQSGERHSQRQAFQQQQQQQYTWIMETGQNEPSPHNRNHTTHFLPHPPLHHPHNLPPHLALGNGTSTTAAAAALYHSLLGANTLPVHFQQLLAASSLLYGSNGQDGTMLYSTFPLYNPSHDSTPSFFLPHPGAIAAAAAASNGSNHGKRCTNCGATSTPSWRRCPAGKDLLCNACGLYQKLHKRPRPFRVAEDGTIRVQRCPSHQTTAGNETITFTATATEGSTNITTNNTTSTTTTSSSSSAAANHPPSGEPRDRKNCYNCHTNDTPLWRKVKGKLYCNACALFYKTHGTHRSFGDTTKGEDEDLWPRQHESMPVGGGGGGKSNQLVQRYLDPLIEGPNIKSFVNIATPTASGDRLCLASMATPMATSATITTSNNRHSPDHDNNCHVMPPSLSLPLPLPLSSSSSSSSSSSNYHNIERF